VNLLARDQSVTWFFKTREGGMGVLQIGGFTEDPAIARIRYKLVKSSNDPEITVSDGERKISRLTLTERLGAASRMSNLTARDKSLAVVATDAAKAGEFEVVKTTLQQMTEVAKRNQTALASVRLLAKRGLRKEALEIATDIDEFTTRDQALSELAR
jgi:hypothetical protein